MEKWYPDDWYFGTGVLKVGKENKVEECRLGLEPRDTYESDYKTPARFCPTSFIKIFPVVEAMRCEGILRYLGGQTPDEIKFIWADVAVRFRIYGIKQE